MHTQFTQESEDCLAHVSPVRFFGSFPAPFVSLAVNSQMLNFQDGHR